MFSVWISNTNCQKHKYAGCKISKHKVTKYVFIACKHDFPLQTKSKQYDTDDSQDKFSVAAQIALYSCNQYLSCYQEKTIFEHKTFSAIFTATWKTPRGAGGEVLKYESGIYMCHGGFKNRGLRERPLTKNRGFQNWPTCEKKGFWS